MVEVAADATPQVELLAPETAAAVADIVAEAQLLAAGDASVAGGGVTATAVEAAADVGASEEPPPLPRKVQQEAAEGPAKRAALLSAAARQQRAAALAQAAAGGDEGSEEDDDDLDERQLLRLWNATRAAPTAAATAPPAGSEELVPDEHVLSVKSICAHLTRVGYMEIHPDAPLDELCLGARSTTAHAIGPAGWPLASLLQPRPSPPTPR